MVSRVSLVIGRKLFDKIHSALSNRPPARLALESAEKGGKMVIRKPYPTRHAVRWVLALACLLAVKGGAYRPANPSFAAIASVPAAPLKPSATGLSLLDIPPAQAIPKVDTRCTDYSGGAAVHFIDGGGQAGTVYFLYTKAALYVCMEANLGTFEARFASLYLDLHGDGEQYLYANQGDYAFHIDFASGVRSSYRGTGTPGGWVLDQTLDSTWNGAAVIGQTGESAEWALSLGSPNLEITCGLFGVGVYHQGFAAAGDDYGWPGSQWPDQPRTWQLTRLALQNCGDRGRVAYVFRGDTADAASFYNLLARTGYTVELIPVNNVLSIPDFSVYDLILVADDSGKLDQWGSAGFTAAQASRIAAGGKPVIGLGEGGYAFFGHLGLFIGWPNGWHGFQDRASRAAAAPAAIYEGLGSDPVVVYNEPANSVGIDLGPAGAFVPGDTTAVALEYPTPDHASLGVEICHLLWGSSGNPAEMTEDGRRLFLNAAAYMRASLCPPVNPTPLPPVCAAVHQDASPPPGTPVRPGSAITYTLTVTYSLAPDCKALPEARLIDSLPPGTLLIPGSATDSLTPTPDGALNWAVHPAEAPQTFTVKTAVDDSVCDGPGQVSNRFALLRHTYPPLVSNLVSHPVTCPPIRLQGNSHGCTAGSIAIDPYPLAAGRPSTVSVWLENQTAISQPVTVTFQSNPGQFGLGLAYSTFDARTMTLPASGTAVLKGIYEPLQPGRASLQVVISSPALDRPLTVQRSLDVGRGNIPGVPEVLMVSVGNPAAEAADVRLAVVNTCPAWTAALTDPPDGKLAGLAPGAVYTATLQVTPPPAPALLGSGCHIDMQGWIDNRFIGRARLLDAPPVSLPASGQPPMDLSAVSFDPDPPKPGQPGQVCVALQNPLVTPSEVAVDFAAAGLGAGLDFTPLGSLSLTLPPRSLDRYCLPWTPPPGATPYHGLQVTLKQAGFHDLYSQRNAVYLRVLPGELGELDIPFRVRNPDLAGHDLDFRLTAVGLDPYWAPQVLTDTGSPPPASLPGRQALDLRLRLTKAAPGGTAPPPVIYQHGDVSQIEMGVYLDGALLGTVTAALETMELYLPILAR
jgi:hypothetical protein